MITYRWGSIHFNVKKDDSLTKQVDKYKIEKKKKRIKINSEGEFICTCTKYIK